MFGINRAGCMAVALAASLMSAADAADTVQKRFSVKDDGTITVPSFNLPYSSYASAGSREYVVGQFRNALLRSSNIESQPSSIEAARRSVDTAFYGPKVERLARLYPYTSKRSALGGVPVESFEPRTGIAPENQHRVLLNVHGGGFMFGGGGPGGAAESIPIAGLGRIKVISVDYRMAPEHRFPAASEDLTAVYRELIKSYRPENIGIYGCSAGGTLAAQAIAWFAKERLPLPGAIGVFCSSTHRFGEGDSTQIWSRMQSTHPAEPTVLDPEKITGDAYFDGASPKDPLAVPAASTEILETFPPTLFITGSRADEMSSAAQSHLELLELGVKSQLLIFDGMEHGFILYPIPEATRAHRFIVKFFSDNLGSKPVKTR